MEVMLTDTKLRNLKPQDKLYKVIVVCPALSGH